MRKEDLPSTGEANISRTAFEKFLANPFLQRSYLLTHSWLSHMQPGRRAGEVPCLSDTYERPKAVQIKHKMILSMYL